MGTDTTNENLENEKEEEAATDGFGKFLELSQTSTEAVHSTAALSELPTSQPEYNGKLTNLSLKCAHNYNVQHEFSINWR